MRLPLEKRIERLEAQEKRIQEKKNKLQNEINSKKRKARTKLLIEIGGSVIKAYKEFNNDVETDKLTPNSVYSFLKNQNERGKYFNNFIDGNEN